MSSIFTLCVVRDEDKILVQKREKTPFKGYWNAPGGKVEGQETPIEACLREVFEETGLQLNEVRFRGVMTVSSLSRQQNTQLLMLFDSNNYNGELMPSSEGEVDWIEIDKIYNSKIIPASTTYLLPYIMESEGIITGKLVYNRELLEVCDISLQV
ncbi:NUDIX domain-containing protein [Paenibacillus sp. Marseille-P2973]|uniref:NUDIX hydrolase n=1 Tax=Paenibacillus sp. Marseille-P2973 TaxID=1871032 RepID=UPI001B35F731|nr:NUDIX domain-containing protein [Paenibacillus sp. Marseille-P2973]